MDQKAINVIRNLALDIMQNSGSGHPGITMSSAPILYTLFTKNLKVNPAVADWINRDRFILSAGHASELLYATMFLCGYPLMLEDLKNFRKFNSKTPGYPSINTPGVDISTGYSGEGLANAVGFALAERIYEQKYNYRTSGFFDKNRLGPLFDYYTYVLVSDADLMEGVSYEAASFAGTYHLGKLIVLYDANNVSGDGPLNRTFTEDVLGRFASMGWDTHLVKNGNSVSDIDKAIKKAKSNISRPSIIKINTVLGDGLNNQGKKELHSEPLSKEVLDAYKEKTKAGSIPFAVLKEPASYMRDQVVNRGIKVYDDWKKLRDAYSAVFKDNQNFEIDNILNNMINFDMTKLELDIDYENKELLRESNHKIMNIVASNVYNFIGGSADITYSTKTYLDGFGDLLPNDFSGRNISFGVRERLMGGILNGLAVSGFRPFGSTYLSFMDNMKPSIRMAALMKLPVTFIFTHDSITTAGDGPTHQPIEQLASLRSMPNLCVFRPADIKEIIGTWYAIVNSRTPVVISLPKTEIKAEQGTSIQEVAKGAYIAGNEQAIVHAVIVATGAEVQVAKSIQVKLLHEGIDVRVVSMPCMELFNVQSNEYKRQIFPEGSPIFVIEYGASLGWEKFVPSSDYLFTIDEFGVSASKDDVLKYEKVDTDSIVEKIKSLLK